ncbi:MAG: alpha-L-fucosidase, partial [Fimbriimonadaceae bacterium]|nr:alpha-L-fucosidase [Fimbriimonadaceae bacterium]
MVGALALAVLMSQTRVVPAPRQLEWHKMQTYAFVHFGPNTFSGQEWGSGSEKPESFNPAQLDCNQWVSVFKKAGMKGVIITAKHHDGFCLWPSKYSTHTVMQSPLKRDVLKELSAACKKQGLKMGVYLSPWDRNHPTYGTEQYNDTFNSMLEEVLGNYGPIFEVWFDGANGEGPNGKRQVYDWKRYIATVRRLQPNAVIFSDAGPDVRWIGNEQGKAPETCWATINRDRYEPGTSLYKELGEGTESGTHWVPGECDVSIRPGWFWRASENARVKSASELENLYYQSVGHGANFLLNVPADTRGLIHEIDAAALYAFRKRIDQTFKSALGESKSGTISLKKQVTFDRIELTEDIAKGQVVREFAVHAMLGGKLVKIASGTTVGAKKLIRLSPVTTDQVVVTSPQSGIRIRLFASPECGRDFSYETKEQKDLRMAWWRESRFGMFIHWGLYSIPAGSWKGKNYGGASEWLISSAGVAPADWEPLQKEFNPVNFDAKKIVGAAKAAGMKYIVITSKHHEGFAIWPSKQGTWHIGNTQFKRDPLKELSEECRRQGIKFCTYHSILDWHHPDFLPRERWDKRSTTGADFERYVTYMKAQLKEVITQYQPAVMWFDGEWQNTWNHERGKDLYNYCRSLKPDMIINNRVDTGRAGMSGFTDGEAAGDFGTPEQEIPVNGVSTDWESCMTMNGSWGYHALDTNWKSVDTLFYNVVDCASKGGNYLLNVGPTALGEIPSASVERLKGVGEIMNSLGEAVYGTQPGPFKRALPWGKVTRKGNVLYGTVFDANIHSVELPGLENQIVSATMLGTRERCEVMYPDADKGPFIVLPKRSGPIAFKLTLVGEPRVVVQIQKQNTDGTVKFDSSEAVVHGASARYEADKKAVGFWTNATDYLSWEFLVTQPGNYQVELEYACEAGSEGSLVAFTCQGNEGQFVVKSTAGWSSFKKEIVARVALKQAGKAVFEVRPRMMPKGAVMNLRSVRLVPIS